MSSLALLRQGRPLPLNCTAREYDAATLEKQRDWNRRLLAYWDEHRAHSVQAETQIDHDEAQAGEIYQ